MGQQYIYTDSDVNDYSSKTGEYDLVEIKEFVRKARKKLELSQEKLGEQMGCTKQNVSSWERGVHHPSYAQLRELSDRSGVPMPEDKSALAVSNMGLNLSQITDEQVRIIKMILNVPVENLPKLIRIIEIFQYDHSQSDREQDRKVSDIKERRVNRDRRASARGTRNRRRMDS